LIHLSQQFAQYFFLHDNCRFLSVVLRKWTILFWIRLLKSSGSGSCPVKFLSSFPANFLLLFVHWLPFTIIHELKVNINLSDPVLTKKVRIRPDSKHFSGPGDGDALHSAEFYKQSFYCDCAPCGVWNPSQKLSCWLRAMLHCAESTPRKANAQPFANMIYP
jgi:hypothetical protein